MVHTRVRPFFFKNHSRITKKYYYYMDKSFTPLFAADITRTQLG